MGSGDMPVSTDREEKEIRQANFVLRLEKLGRLAISSHDLLR